MAIILNILVLALILLVAYWWGSQGLFSSLLHLLATIAAAAMAFALWEPIVYALLGATKSKALVGLVWGGSLLILFAVFLALFRLALDKSIPNNLNFPHWADLSIGGALGWASGTISIGVLLIGFGFIQSKPEFMGYNGYQRYRGDGQVKLINGMWYPAHAYTGQFMELLSATSLSSGKPMARYAPQIARQASLFRDTAVDGKGQSTMPPSGMKLSARDPFTFDPADPSRFFVAVEFLAPSFDFGGQLTVTSAQVRLVEAAADPTVLHPQAWFQDHQKRSDEGKNNYHEFDTISAILSSEGTRAPLKAVFEFRAPAGFVGHDGRRGAVLLVKNIRYDLPKPTEAVPALLRQMEPAFERPEFVAGGNIDELISFGGGIRGLNASTNLKPSGIILGEDNYIVSGKGVFPPNRDAIISRPLRIKGIIPIEGEAIVQVDMTRGKAADVFSLVEQGEVRIEDEIFLTDERGNKYFPVGYWSKVGGAIEVDMRPAERIPEVGMLPRGSVAGNEELRLIFRVTEGAQLTGLKAGSVIIGEISKKAQSPRQR